MSKLLFCITFLVACSTFASCSGQKTAPASASKNEIVGGGCDGCELMYVGMPKKFSSSVISSGWNETGQKLIISGNVFQLDRKTPAPDVVIYFWQTDHAGYYSPKDGMDEKARRHGHIRGWVKTDNEGRYSIQTIRPAPYPDETMPAHIHLAIKEPDVASEYYTDEINFEDDTLLMAHFKTHPPEKRGGSAVVKVASKGNVQTATHNIILGMNIPNYPAKPVSD